MRTYTTTIRYNENLLGRVVKRDWDYFPLAYLAMLRGDGNIIAVNLTSQTN